MEENMFSSDQCYLELRNTYQGEIGGTNETGTTKLYRPTFAVLPLIGIDVRDGKSTTRDIFRMLYLFVLLLISVWLAGCQLYPMLSHELTKESSWYVSDTDQYVVMAIVYVAGFKNQKVAQLVKDIWSTYNEMADARGANYRKLKRWLWTMWVATLINTIILGSITVVTALDDPIEYSKFQKKYFGIKTKSLKVVQGVTLVTNIAVELFVIILFLFGCFAIIQCFLIKKCFKGLNVALTAKGRNYLCDYLIKHRQLSGMIVRFNETFHPAILTLVCVLMSQIVTLTQDTSNLIQKDDRSYLKITKYLLYLVQTIMIFVIFVHFGREIQIEVRKGVEILLESSISTGSSTNEELHDDKNGQMINLFIAQLNTAPVAISASGIFNINVNLITIVISIAITYLTFVVSLKSGKAIAPTIAYNFSTSTTLPVSSSTAP